MARNTAWRVLSGMGLAVSMVLFGASTTHGANSTSSAADFAQLSQNATQHVIVMLSNQHGDLEGRSQRAARTAAIQGDQAPVLSQLAQAHAEKVTPFHVINAIDATVSPTEAAALRANPSVQTVIPDRVVPSPVIPVQSVPSTSGTNGTTVTGSLSNLCGTQANPIQNEDLSVTNDLQATQMTTPQGQKIDGSGVTVAYIAEGIDPNNVEFIRPDGSHVITDYEDFNGSGPIVENGEEAFGDASSIAAQGNKAYDVSHFSALHLANPCYVKIQGMAPGASVMALRVFGRNPAYSGVFIRAIEYAVDHGADVLNESFGGNPYPNYANDPISLADSVAVADGVTVTASSGDAGTTETLGSPSTNQDVIETGATTDLRSEEQVDYPGTGQGTGWLSNEISPFSSGGISQNGQRTIDVVAPGNSDWAACDACADFESASGAPTVPFESFGGTSESAPVTAGEAALIIQAYRSTHNGANPAPGEVKQIIKSTATNLDYPSDVQGAGLINASKAVQAALSLPDSNGSPQPVGDSFVYATHAGTSDPASTLSAQDSPNTAESFSVQATNTGAHTETFTPQVLTLALDNPSNYTVNLNSSDTTFNDAFGRNSFKVDQPFAIPAGKQYMTVQIAWPNTIPNNNSRVRMTLFDPEGRNAIYSRPQGTGEGWGNVEIHDPEAGTWHAVIWTIDPTLTAASYFGPVHLTVQTGTYVSAGSVSPASSNASPGQTVRFTVVTRTPANPGDESVNVQMIGTSASGQQTSVIPLNLRSYITPVAGSATFGGTLLGGNGRPGAPGDTKTYSFRVTAGTKDISLGVTVGTALNPDPNYNLEGMLVDPDGNPVDVQSTATSQDPKTGAITGSTDRMQFFWANPQPGLWTYVQFVNGFASGAQTQEPFSGTLRFNSLQVSLSNMPNAAQAPGTTFTAEVSVTNTGNEPEQVFVDPRQLAQSTYTEAIQGGHLPGAAAFTLAPPETTQVTTLSENALAQSSGGDPYDTELVGVNGQAPVGGTGIPDVMGESGFDSGSGVWTSVVQYGNGSDTPVPMGFFETMPSLQGPFASAANPHDVFLFEPEFSTKTFDPNVCPSNGDFWEVAVDQFAASPAATNAACNGGNYTPLTVAPGSTVQVPVQFTVPTTGHTVSGQLDVDSMSLTFAQSSNIGTSTGFIQNTGDGNVLAQLHYRYSVS